MKGWGAWVSQNLFAILAAGAVMLQGYASAQTATTKDMGRLNERLGDLEARMKSLEGTQSRRYYFLQCAVRTLDRLVDKAGVRAPCPMVAPD